MLIDEFFMPTKKQKMAYIQSLTAKNAFEPIKSKQGFKATMPFVTASKMFDKLKAAFKKVNQKQKTPNE